MGIRLRWCGDPGRKIGCGTTGFERLEVRRCRRLMFGWCSEGTRVEKGHADRLFATRSGNRGDRGSVGVRSTLGIWGRFRTRAERPGSTERERDLGGAREPDVSLFEIPVLGRGGGACGLRAGLIGPRAGRVCHPPGGLKGPGGPGVGGLDGALIGRFGRDRPEAGQQRGRERVNRAFEGWSRGYNEVLSQSVLVATRRVCTEIVCSLLKARAGTAVADPTCKRSGQRGSGTQGLPALNGTGSRRAVRCSRPGVRFQRGA